MTRFAPDAELRRFGRVLLGGSPLRLFRVSDAGADAVDRIVDGDDVPMLQTEILRWECGGAPTAASSR